MRSRIESTGLGFVGGLALAINGEGTGDEVYVGGGQGDDGEQTEIISIFLTALVNEHSVMRSYWPNQVTK